MQDWGREAQAEGQTLSNNYDIYKGWCVAIDNRLEFS